MFDWDEEFYVNQPRTEYSVVKFSSFNSFFYCSTSIQIDLWFCMWLRFLNKLSVQILYASFSFSFFLFPIFFLWHNFVQLEMQCHLNNFCYFLFLLSFLNCELHERISNREKSFGNYVWDVIKTKWDEKNREKKNGNVKVFIWI